MSPANVETMAYAGEVPWHGLGTQVAEAMTSEEAIRLARLDWDVELQAIFTGGIAGSLDTIPTHKATVRQTDKSVLGVVGTHYRVVQNREAFGFFDSVTEKDARYHTAGSLKGGRVIWILAKLQGEIMVTKDDVVDKYILLSTGHDGMHALTMLWTPIRVVCQNTLNIAMATSADKFYARHTIKVADRVGQAKDILGLADKFYNYFEETAKRLTILALPEPDMKLLASYLVGFDVTKDREYAPKQDAFDNIMALVETGAGVTADIRGTRWGFFNAVAEYADYMVPLKKTAGRVANETGMKEARLDSVWYGRSAAMKRETWKLMSNDTALERALAEATKK